MMILKDKRKVLIKYIIKENNNIILGNKLKKQEIDLNDNNELSILIYNLLKNKKIGFSAKFNIKKLLKNESNIESFQLKDFPEKLNFDTEEIIVFGIENKRIGRVVEINNEILNVDFSNPLRKNDIVIELKLIDIL